LHRWIDIDVEKIRHINWVRGGLAEAPVNSESLLPEPLFERPTEIWSNCNATQDGEWQPLIKRDFSNDSSYEWN
jgi:hypothetical protein